MQPPSLTPPLMAWSSSRDSSFWLDMMFLLCEDEYIKSVDKSCGFAKNSANGVTSGKSTGHRCQNPQGSVDIIQLFNRKLFIRNFSDELVLDGGSDHCFV